MSEPQPKSSSDITDTPNTDIYDPSFVASVFDRCTRNYRWWSEVSSFGFVRRWRKQCVQALPTPQTTQPIVVDLMAGTGEIWPILLKRLPTIKHITAIDISHQMHQYALERLHQERSDRIEHIEANFLENNLPSDYADAVISSFGLKTLNHEQQRVFAEQLSRILKPGGTFSLIEASDPRGWWLRPFYRFYLDRLIPTIEKLFLKGAQDFSMIGVYTRQFGSCQALMDDLRAAGLTVKYQPYFFGCASGLSGCKPQVQNNQ